MSDPAQTVLIIASINHEEGIVVVRTNLGPDVARRFAAFELEVREVFISVIMETTYTRTALLREMVAAKREKRRYVPPPPTHDYIFTETCGRRVTLPDGDPDEKRGLSQDWVRPRAKHRLKSTEEHIRHQAMERSRKLVEKVREECETDLVDLMEKVG